MQRYRPYKEISHPSIAMLCERAALHSASRAISEDSAGLLMERPFVCQRRMQSYEAPHRCGVYPLVLTPLAQEDVPDQVAEMFTRRSGTAPSTFSALEWPTSYSAHQLEIIASQLHRTKHLGVLAYQDRGFASFLNNLYKTDMKDLEELILCQSYDLKTHHLDITPSLCGGHPFHLISLKLKGFSIRGLPCAPSLQWLTLELARFSYEVLRTGLLSVHQLQELDIAAFQPDDQIHSRLLLELVPVSLPCLKSLKIRVEIFCLSSLLSLLPDPQVTFKLDIYGNDGAPAPPVDDFELNQAMARVMRFWEATTGQPAS
jgi:hypothetical protein